MKKSRGARLAAAGFTLIELVMTLVVVGILAVFAVGRMDFVPTFEQRGVRDKLIAGLAYARKAAVGQRRNVCVAIAAGTVTFTLDTRTPETAGAAACNGSSSVPLALPSPDRDCGGGVSAICSRANTAIAGGSAFLFDAQGAASATVVFTVTVPGQPATTVTVNAQTGYVN